MSWAAALKVPAGTTTAEGDPFLDRGRLTVLLGGDAEAVSDVLQSFAEDAPHLVAGQCGRCADQLAIGAVGRAVAAHVTGRRNNAAQFAARAGHLHVLVAQTNDGHDRAATIRLDDRIETRIEPRAD